MPELNDTNRLLALQRLMKTDDPKTLVNEIAKTSFGVSVADDGEGNFDVNENLSTGRKIPKTYGQQPVAQTNRKIPSAIMEDYMQRNQEEVEQYRQQMYQQPSPKPQRLNETVQVPNNLSLKIDGIQYSGKIVQNSKGLILYVVGDKKAFILTPSDLKNLK